jgi:hypothetical protein
MQVEDSARTVWERSTLRSSVRSYLRADLAVLWWLRRSETGRFFALPMRHVVSMNPLRDVAMLTWTGLVAGVFYSGYHFSMNCALNAGCVLLLRALVAAKRPIEYDVALKQLADRTRGNYGLPCLATHMAVVVFGQLAISLSAEFEDWAPAIWTAAAALVTVVAFSRLVAGSRFVYQVAFSLGTGALGVAYARRATSKIQPWREEWHNFAKNREHVTFAIIAAALGAAYIAAGAEDNSSWFFSIPNDEFVRVMRGVYASRGAAPRRKTKSGEQYAPNDALSNLTARMAARGATPVL